MIDWVARWVFRRFRRRYFLALEVIGDVFSVLGVTALPIVSLCRYYDLKAGEMGIFFAAATVVVATGVRASLYLNRKRLAPMKAWLRDEEVDPVTLWRTALTFVAPLVTTAFWIAVFFAVPALAYFAERYVHPDFVGFTGIMLTGAAVLTAGFITIYQGYQIFARPPIHEIALGVPIGSPMPKPGLSLSTRLTMSVATACVLSGAYAICWTDAVADRGNRLAFGILVMVFCGAYNTFIVRVGIIDTSFRPLSDVVDATKRVREGDFAEAVPVTTTDEFGQLAFAVNDMQRGLRERAALHTAFGSYVDPALARRLIDEGDAVFEGEEVDVSVFFADIRGFTAYAETASVREAVATLNRFFAIVVRIVTEHGGHTNAYLGDGVLAVFGTPQALDDHADRAVAAACAVQRAVCEEFGESLRIGIGINTGSVIAGTVGGEGKLEYTVIGDTVNVAARVEQLTKVTGDGILLTAQTVESMQTQADGLTDCGDFEVRGKQARLRLYSFS